MRIERKQSLTKREFLGKGGLLLVGFLLTSDEGLAIEKNKQTDTSKVNSNFLGEWRGLVASLLGAIGLRETFSKTKRGFSPMPLVDDNQSLEPLHFLTVERRVKDLRERLGELKVDKKLIKKQLESLQRSYKGRAVRLLNNLKIIPFGREGEWVFLIDSGLYCVERAKNLCEKGDIFGASLFLAIADEDRIILNKESWKYQNQISFEGLKEIDKKQGTFKYGREWKRKTYLEVIDDKREDKKSAILFHGQLARYLRGLIEREEPLSEQILDRVLFTEISIARAVHEFLVLPGGIIYEGYGGDRQEHSQAEGLLEEIEKKLKDMLLIQVNYQQFSKQDKVLAYWSLARTIEKFKDFEGEVLGQTETVSDEKGNLAVSVVQS